MINNKITITHLTSNHPRYDTRIFVKECNSLAKVSNYKVNLIVADNLGNEFINNINIIDVGKLEGRFNRIFKTTKEILNKAIEINSNIYHIHDAELIYVGIKLKKLGRIVVFDAHEDIPNEILAKPYINKYIKLVLSKIFNIYEMYSLKKFDYIITATSYIKNKFSTVNKSIDINNYPLIEELSSDVEWKDRKDQVCYIGVIAKTRGNLENVEAMTFVNSNIKFKLAGIIHQKSFEKELKENNGWKKVDFVGKLSRNEVKELLAESKVGLVTLYPLISYKDALPVKMFEYMVAGIPVIISNIPLWKEIIEGNKCGVCVNPYNSKEIAEKITYLFNNQEEAKQMGLNGKKAVLEKYNWMIEEKKLFIIYRELIDGI